MESFNQPHPFKSGTTRAQWTKYLLSAGIAVSVVNVITDLFVIRKLSNAAGSLSMDEYQEMGIDLVDFAELGSGLATVVVNISTIVLFLMWFHRAYSNLKALGAKGLQYSPGWAIGAWFIPFGNLFIPFRIAKEIWNKSDTETAEFGFLSGDSTVPGFFGLWWGFWVASSIASNAAFRLSIKADTVGENLAANWISLVAELLSIPAAIFAMRVITAIDERQTESSKHLPQAIFPPPPTYGSVNS